MAVFGTVSFQDTTPFTLTWTQGGGGSRDLLELGSPGAVATGVWWGYSRVASGGYNDGGYLRWTWYAWDDSESGHDSRPSGFTESGYRMEPGGTSTEGQANWPDTFFARFRVYFENGIHPYTGSLPGSIGVEQDRPFKFFMWHLGVDAFDGDHRIIVYFAPGDTVGESNSTHVGIHVERNISHNTEVASVAVPIGQWAHVQFSWKHGVENTSYLKAWLNNNTEGSPSAQDLNLPEVYSNPGGSSEWVQAQEGYDDQFYIGNAANQGTALESAFTFRLMDFTFADTYDATWAPGASGSRCAFLRR